MKPDFSKAWLAQRRAGDVAVARVNEEELAAMTDEVALAQIDALLSLGAASPQDPERATFSGFVIQQRLFAKARR
jgi:hypothetical protein